MPRGKKLARTCNADQMINKKDSKSPRSTRWFSLFEQKKTRGWWPFLAKNMHGEVTLTGKVDLELELLTEEDADKKPVGLGREEPLALPEPKRPETSFAWFMSPLKFAKFIIWDGMKYKCLIALLILLGILFVLMFIYGLPNYMAAQIMRKIL